MFTGIIAAVGSITRIAPTTGGQRLAIDAGGLDMSDVAIGDSIAVNGVCLTAVLKDGKGFEADVSNETLRVTPPSCWRAGWSRRPPTPRATGSCS